MANEIIVLDDSADNSQLFVFDETPIKEHVNSTDGKKRKRKKKIKKPGVVLGGKYSSDQNDKTVTKKEGNHAKKKRKSSSNSVVVIDDDSDDDDVCVVNNVIELSDDERNVGVIGGVLSASFQEAQRQLCNYQQQLVSKRKRNVNTTGKLEPVENLQSWQRLQKSAVASSSVDLTVPRKLRPIIVDGSNVAFGHGTNKCFSSRGIQICCEYFQKRGHTVKVFIPQFRKRHPGTVDPHILDKLENERVLVYTPSRSVNGKKIVSYDDRMIVEYASQCGGVIVTKDNYQDLLKENPAFHEVISERLLFLKEGSEKRGPPPYPIKFSSSKNFRLLMFTWVDDTIMFPQDPLGRSGPKLDDFLSFPVEEETLSKDKDMASKSS